MSALSNVQDTLHPFGQAAASKPTSGPPTGKIRVVNLIYLGDKPAGPLDLYNVFRPDFTAKPIITNLAFGQLSAYVTPRSPSSQPGVPSNLYMFPAGSRTVALPYGALEMSGFVQGDQVTVVLGPSTMGANGIARFDVAEEGKRIVKERQDTQHAIPPGKALVKCSRGTLGATTTLTMQPGRRYLALMYGLESDGFRVVTAAIDLP